MRTALATGILILLIAVEGAPPSVLQAAPVNMFLTPTTIRVEMYELFSSGASTGKLCSPANNNLTQWGCTATSSLGLYPWSDPYQNPVTVQIEGTAVDNRYLRDVVPQEMGPAAYHPTAIGAQAIAARTFAYYHIQQG
ncbi:MAG: hypothetical protein CVU38_20550, partial [Chloroflexi bacterium HGW-Chloroflexi-1]